VIDRIREIALEAHAHSLDTFVNQAESPIEMAVLWSIIATLHGSVATRYVTSEFDAPGFVHSENPLQYSAAFRLTCECCPVVVLPQCRVRTAAGIYRLDMAIRFRDAEGPTSPTWVNVECDGHEYHERTKEQAERDKERDREVQALGYEVARFTGSEINRDPLKAAEKILSFCHAVHIRRRHEVAQQAQEAAMNLGSTT
jgi:hypothetical protein